MSNYFSFIPDVFVRTSSYRVGGNDPYVMAKNLFRRIKIRDGMVQTALGFESYAIQSNERPDQVADKFYNDPEYDWVILLCNNIVNIYDDWPMEEGELFKYIKRKYGSTDDIHHWETQEVRNTKGTLQLRAGIQVNEDFEYTRPDGTSIPTAELVAPVSNYQYEAQLNEYRRNIYILKPAFLTQFVEEFENLTEYLPSNEVDPQTGIKRSVGIISEAFRSVKPTYTSLVGQAPSIEFASRQEFTSRSFGSSASTISEGDVLADGSTVAVTNAASGTTSAVTEQAGSSSTSSSTNNQYGSAGSSTGQQSGGGY